MDWQECVRPGQWVYAVRTPPRSLSFLSSSGLSLLSIRTASCLLVAENKTPPSTYVDEGVRRIVLPPLFTPGRMTQEASAGSGVQPPLAAATKPLRCNGRTRNSLLA